MPDSALVFGASGQLGAAIAAALVEAGVDVTRATRSAQSESGWLSLAGEWRARVAPRTFDRIVWAQGVNSGGGIRDAGAEDVRSLLEANVVFVVDTLRNLLAVGAVAEHARLVIVSSIWQETTRQDKLAYSVSKAAVAGLVRSLAADLGPTGIRVNAVLPGPVDGPLTHANMSDEQLAGFVEGSPLGRLVAPVEVANACVFLTSPASSGITAQSLVVDAGWSATRHV